MTGPLHIRKFRNLFQISNNYEGTYKQSFTSKIHLFSFDKIVKNTDFAPRKWRISRSSRLKGQFQFTINNKTVDKT